VPTTTHRRAIPAPSYVFERTVLGNGLRVLMVPDRSVPAVAVAVYYDVGMRSEPEGRTGFAHLFEHLMFQGSAGLEKLEHSRHVQSAGGVFNGTTHLDYTNYYELVPSNALERMLFLEADRMRGPRITPENLANQIAVVKEEIRVNVLNRPYGGFPWLTLPPLLFSTFPNAHNGYGDFVDLEAATVDDATGFFRRYYAPSNALLCIAGDIETDATVELVERHFGGIASRRKPVRSPLSEAGIDAEHHETITDAHAPLPAVATAWRVPDPVIDLAAYLPFVVLAEVLTDGDSSRLQHRLVRADRIATQVGGYLGFLGDPFDVRDPTAMLLSAVHPPDVPAKRVLAAIDEEMERLSGDGVDRGELGRVTTRLAAQILRELDSVLGRAQAAASLQLVHDRAGLVGELPELVGRVTDAQVRGAAAALRPDRRAVSELLAGAA